MSIDNGKITRMYWLYMLVMINLIKAMYERTVAVCPSMVSLRLVDYYSSFRRPLGARFCLIESAAMLFVIVLDSRLIAEMLKTILLLMLLLLILLYFNYHHYIILGCRNGF